MFRKLVLAAALATGLSATTSVAQEMSESGFGDLALVPYYTVQGGYITGVHLINNSDYTQVVKMRLRRATDSMDALDFNLILSPRDMWTGWLSSTQTGDIRFNTTDNSCTAPALQGNGFTMPSIFREGAEEGYIEVIGMGQIDLDSPIGRASKHQANGEPLDCESVRSNFFSIQQDYPQAAGVLAVRGVQNSAVTHQTVSESVQEAQDFTCNGGVCVNEFEDTDNVLKVAYFIRDTESGVEFGNQAVHIENFLDEPALTNQQFGLASGDLSGFDFPDLNGGSIDGTRGVFDSLRSPKALGAFTIVNDWSANPNNGVSTDWVITMPGQYSMLKLSDYLADLDSTDEDDDCTRANDCDQRDLPVTVSFDIYDREEGVFTPREQDLVVSPSPPVDNPGFKLENEVNVIEWNASNSVLGSDVATTVDTSLLPSGAVFGFSEVGVTSSADTGVCSIVDAETGEYTCVEPKFENVPIIGFAVWKRQIPNNPAAEYGRLVEHSYVNERVRPESQELPD
jgi:hypothetical protein